MDAMSQQKSAPEIHRVLGTRDLILLNVVAIVGLRWIARAAQIGPSSLILWLLGFICFFVPLACSVLELSSRLPGEGGLYIWAKAAMGDFHGFVAGWTYWIANLVFFPSLLLFSSGIFLYIGGADWLGWSENSGYNGIYGMTVMWAATGLNIIGLHRVKWLQNIGGICTWSAAVVLVLAGAYSWSRFGAATTVTSANLLPDFSKLATFTSFATIAMAYTGLELGPMIGGEMKDPRRQVPLATLVSGLVVAFIYIAGTGSIFVALPAATIDAISGIPQALNAVGERIGFPYFARLTALLVTVGTVGAISANITCTARLPYVVGADRYLPVILSRLHPRYGTPHFALIIQGLFISLVLMAALSGSTIHEAFNILIDMTVILSLLPLLYIFIALPVLRFRAGPVDAGVTRVPGGNVICIVIALTGFATTFLAIVTSMVPEQGNANVTLFLVKVVGGSMLLIGVGLLFYWRGQQKMAAATAAHPVGNPVS